MAVVRAGEIDRFIANAGRGARIVLIFGPDEGAVRLNGQAFANAFLGPGADPTSLLDLEAETLNADPGRLADEANAIGMFGDRRAIIVRHAGRLAKAIWQTLLAADPPEAAIVLLAEELGKSAPIRIAAESNPNVAAIACYRPSPAEIAAMIEARCRSAGLTIAPAARNALTELMGSDQAVSENEIEKLLLFCGGKRGVELEDIEQIVSDSSAGTGSEAIDFAFDGQLPAIEGAVERSLREGASGAGLISLALAHVHLLRRLVSAAAEGRLDAAIKQERLHFRREGRVRRQAEKWSLLLLGRVLENLSQAQIQGRLTASLEETVAIRALWAVALAARRR